MNKGTVVSGQLIVDSRFVRSIDLDSAISIQRDNLTNIIHENGLEVYEMGGERNLHWKDGTKQIRQGFKLILTKRMTKDEVYEIINQVRAQPLTFTNYGY